MERFKGFVSLTSSGLGLLFPVTVAAMLRGVSVTLQKEREGVRIRVQEDEEAKAHFHEKVLPRREGDFRASTIARSKVLRNGSSKLQFGNTEIEFEKNNDGAYVAFIPKDDIKPIQKRSAPIRTKVEHIGSTESNVPALLQPLGNLGLAQVKLLIQAINNVRGELGLSLRVEDGELKGTIEL